MWCVFLIMAVHGFCGWYVATRLLRPKRLSDVPLLALLISFVSFYTVPIAAGWMTGRMNLWVIAGSSTLAIIVVGIAHLKGTSPWSLRQVCGSLQQFTFVSKFLALIILLILAASLLLGASLPIRTWDAATYHAINPMRWAETGRFLLDSYGEPQLFPLLTRGEVFPNAKAILPFLVLRLTQSEAGTALAQWPFLCLLVCSLFALFRRMHLSHEGALTGILFCLAAPEVLLQSIEAYSDLAYFSGQVAVTSCLLILWQDGFSARWACAAAAAFAVLTASKSTGLPMAAAYGLMALAMMNARRLPWPRRLSEGGIFVLLVLVLCTLTAGPWYVRGLVHYGNPIYPVEFRIGPWKIFDGPYAANVTTLVAQQYQEAHGIRAWWKAMSEAYRPAVLSAWTAGLGAHAFMIGLPALILLLPSLVHSTKRPRPWMGFALLAVSSIVSPVHTVPRFLLHLLALMGVSFAWIAAGSSRTTRVALAGILVLCIAYNMARVAPSILYRPRPAEVLAFSLMSGHSSHTVADTFPDEFSSLDYWREHLSLAGGTLAIPKRFLPWLGRPSFKSTASVVRVAERVDYGTSDEWVRYLRGTNATYLYAPKSSSSFKAAMENARDFKLLMHRLDSSQDTPLGLTSGPEDAVFQIIGKPGNS